MKYIVFALAVLVIVAGCVQEKAPIKEISIPGQAKIYQFTNDLRSAVLVKSNDETGIKNIFYAAKNINIVFDGSSETDNAYFSAVLIDFGAKVPLYLSYDGVQIKFTPFYTLSDDWYNATDDKIPEPTFIEPVLVIKGPSTGAEETSVNLYNNTIVLQGTSYKNLTLAGDKLTLIVFGIDKDTLESLAQK
ncbi:MAG TPA: hypothetical protein VI968_04385 [archaeon]|nr:hypothetical protein [archaeon]